MLRDRSPARRTTTSRIGELCCECHGLRSLGVLTHSRFMSSLSHLSLSSHFASSCVHTFVQCGVGLRRFQYRELVESSLLKLRVSSNCGWRMLAPCITQPSNSLRCAGALVTPGSQEILESSLCLKAFGNFGILIIAITSITIQPGMNFTPAGFIAGIFRDAERRSTRMRISFIAGISRDAERRSDRNAMTGTSY